MNKIKNLPDLIPSLLLDYDRTDRFSPSINFKRNVVQFQDRINSVTIAGIDTPQYRLGPLGTGPRGILVQGAYTNLIPNNVTFSNNIFAIEGSYTNHIATNVSNIGPRGLSALTMITQAASSVQPHPRGLFFVYGSMGGLSKTYAFSAYVKQAGTKPTNASIRIGYYPDGAGDNYAVNLYCDFKTLVDKRNYRAFPVGDGWWRVEHVLVPNVSNVGAYIGIYARGDVAARPPVGWEVDYCGFQVEDTTGYGLATSYIRTNGSYETRAQEISSFPINTVGISEEMTLVLNVGYNTYIQGRVLQLSDGSTANNGTRVISLQVADGVNAILHDTAYGVLASGLVGVTKDGCFRIGIVLSKDRTKCHMNINGRRMQPTGQGMDSVGFSNLINMYLGLGNNAVGYLPYLLVNKIAIWDDSMTVEQLDTIVEMI